MSKSQKKKQTKLSIRRLWKRTHRSYDDVLEGFFDCKNWTEVSTREFMWDRQVVEAQALKAVARADVIDVFDRCVAEGGSERRRLVTLMLGGPLRGVVLTN